MLSKLAPVTGLEIKPNRRFGRTINNRRSIVQEEDLMLRILGLATVIALSAFSAAAQTADEINEWVARLKEDQNTIAWLKKFWAHLDHVLL